MNQRLFSVLAFAFVVSAGASLLLYRLLASHMVTQAAPGSTQLVLAARALEPGTLVRDGDLKIATWSGTVPLGAIRKKEDIIGRGVTFPILVNEPLVESRLALKGAGAGLAALIPPGMRAVAIRVNEIVGVAGFVVPGMRVDILVSGNPPGGAPLGGMTKTILQNVQVLSAGQNFQKDAEGKPISVPVVNLLVTPEQAEILSLASSQTSIQLVLRNPLDNEIAKTTGSAVAQLFHSGVVLPHEENRAVNVPVKQPPHAVAPSSPPPVGRPASGAQSARPSARVVEVIHGVKRAETRFESGQEVKP